MKDHLITSYKTELYRLAEGKNVEIQLHAQLVHEKWFHYLAKRKMMKELRSPRRYTDNNTPLESEEGEEIIVAGAGALASVEGVEEVGEGAHKKDFHNLFPSNYTARQGEMALVLWDFLDR